MTTKRNTNTTGRKGSGKGSLSRRNASRRNSTLRSSTAFEPLETRQLMATINVTDFGARPNDGGNDTGAIQAAVNSSGSGDTILFSGGTFNVPDGITLPGNRTYKGQNGATLSGKNSEGWVVRMQQDNATFTGLTFETGGVFVEKPGGGWNNNITFDYNTFRLNTGGDKGNGITFTNGLQNSKITNNYFTGYACGYAIYGYNYNFLTIANNEVVNARAGFHIDSFANGGNLLVEQNYITGAKGMGFEFQSTAHDLIFQDNWYEHPNISPNFHDNDNTMAYSLILDKSRNITIRRNTCIAPERPDGTGTRVGFELGGDNSICEDNYINGVSVSAYCTDGSGTCSVTLRNNKFMNYQYGDYIAFPQAGRSYTSYNNGPNTQLTWDINRAKPGIGAKRYGGTNTTPPASDLPSNTPPAPTPSAPAAPTNLLGMGTGDTTANIFWNDVDNETGYKVQRSTDGGKTWSQVAQLGADDTNYTATGLTAGTSYSFRVQAYNSAGSSNSTAITVIPRAVDESNGKSLSDMKWLSSTNGWGPAERDMSNGEVGAGDGHALTLAGKTYAKGVGVHANSQIVVSLGGRYKSFLSDIGVDEESGANGSVVFEVWGDGVKLYSSDTMTGNTATKSINVDVTGVQELKLVVNASSDNINNDHADWANARFMLAPVADPTPTPVPDPTPDPVPVDPAPKPDPKPDTTTPPPTGPVYLSDLTPTSIKSGWGPIELNKSNGEAAAGDGHTLTLAGKTYTKGLGVHSDSELHYKLNGQYATFSADIGLDDEVGNGGSVSFQVWADGIMLYNSGKMTGASATKTVNVNVQGRQEMWIVVGSTGDGFTLDHADWANARLAPTPTAVTGPITYLSDMRAGDLASGWGPAQMNTSNGEKAADDGNLLSLDGKTYGKGLGVHSDSRLVYNLDGKYLTFITDLGIDDEVGNNGSVVFKIFADGVQVYNSGLMTGASKTQTAVVDVKGIRELSLVVSNAGDGYTFDHADWANARLAA